ncbi:uncharacterized protein EV422DRAFT_542159 [Fimicolochytrium jonesii]|uniref:uncharacterized protein n=1 Tax=Fimicolochytrium jonesii TaxID=1396493 RepID=UPI0022FEC4F5|nr:uncharacterized protein EV422DRAFT_542159 [Fimicolochytrium jonesii]KAI8817263.1 hypothetical protein EV422DRAFT_542159 [Fimicolochytrium jonesii]
MKKSHSATREKGMCASSETGDKFSPGRSISNCTCDVCTGDDRNLERKIQEHQELDESLGVLGSHSQVPQGLLVGKRIIALYDELEEGSKLYHRTFYDLFQIAIQTRKTTRRAVGYIAHSARWFYGEESEVYEEAERFRKYPSSHRNHLLGDL